MATTGDNQELTEDQWKAVRGLLKEALLSGEIPMEPKEMRPKAVYQKFALEKSPAVECIDYSHKRTQDKFVRMLRSLRKKHMDGDLEDEDKGKPVEWGKSAAKQFLKKSFRNGTIDFTFETKAQIKVLWDNHCANHKAFARLEFNDTFCQRIRGIRDDHVKKVKRCQEDLVAYKIAKKNHPTPAFNVRGEPQWNGSEAQRVLKDLVAKGEHIGVLPGTLWSDPKYKGLFQVYTKRTFRDHIYQEERLVKFDGYVEALKKGKVEALQY